MSISAVGGAGNQNQLLLSLLSQLNSTPSPTGSASAGNSSSSGVASPPAGSQDNALTGSSKAQLSDQILGLLMMMQSDPSQATGSSPSATSPNPSNPLTSLVSSIDTDGDGSISQSEMESFIEGQGGTQAQADTLFGTLNQNGSGNLTQAQLTSDLENAGSGQATGHAHGHHHHHHGGSAAASSLFQTTDPDSDGTSSTSSTTTNGQTQSGVIASPFIDVLDELAKDASTAATTQA